MKRLLVILAASLPLLSTPARAGEYMFRGTVYTVTAATNATPIVVTTASHGLAVGDVVRIRGVSGNPAANGDWTCSAISATTCTLSGSVGNGDFTGNGTMQPYAAQGTKVGAWFDVSRCSRVLVHIYCAGGGTAAVNIESTETGTAPGSTPMNSPAAVLATITNPTAAGTLTVAAPSGLIRANVTSWTSGVVYAVIEAYRDSVNGPLKIY